MAVVIKEVVDVTVATICGVFGGGVIGVGIVYTVKIFWGV